MPFAATNGIEVPLLYAAGAVTLALTGPGLFSLDALLGLESLWTPGIVWAAIAIGVIGGVVNLGLRRSPPPVRNRLNIMPQNTKPRSI